jgi:YHS domain-containing protein
MSEQKAESSDEYKKQSYNLPELAKGDKAICPVMGTKFEITDTTEYVTVNGKKIYYCCGGCKEPLEKEPDKYLK